MDLDDLVPRLPPDRDGIYQSDHVNAVAYVDDDHDACLAVEDSSYWFQHRNNCISSLVSRFHRSGLFLDVGGGNGFVSRRLIDEGVDAVLIEPGAHGAQNAKRIRSIPNVICSTFQQADIPKESAGGIGAFDVIEHIADDHAFVASLAASLRHDGMLFATVPAHRWLWSAADDDACHFRRYTEASLRALLAPHFDVSFISYFFSPLVLPIWLMRSLPYRIGIRRQGDADSEHGTSNGIGARALRAILKHEAKRIVAGKALTYGASLIVAARKR